MGVRTKEQVLKSYLEIATSGSRNSVGKGPPAEEVSEETAKILSTAANSSLLKHRCLGLTFRDPDSVDIRWSLQICIFTKVPDDAYQLVQEHTLSSRF